MRKFLKVLSVALYVALTAGLFYAAFIYKADENSTICCDMPEYLETGKP